MSQATNHKPKGVTAAAVSTRCPCGESIAVGAPIIKRSGVWLHYPDCYQALQTSPRLASAVRRSRDDAW